MYIIFELLIFFIFCRIILNVNDLLRQIQFSFNFVADTFILDSAFET